MDGRSPNGNNSARLTLAATDEEIAFVCRQKSNRISWADSMVVALEVKEMVENGLRFAAG